MKLFCSPRLQQKMGWTCAKAPAPTDPLDGWYVTNTILNRTEAVVALLPAFRFCVLLWDIQEAGWDDFHRRLVKGMRATLDDPYYRIPLSLINRYLPADTVLEPCTPAWALEDQTRGILRSVLDSTSLSPLDHWNGTGNGPAKALLLLNHKPFFPAGGEDGVAPWRALRTQLQQRYGKAAPAIELEVSLGPAYYDARRTLIVSADTSFYFLSAYLHAAFHWRYGSHHQFVLPPTQEEERQLVLLGDGMDVLALPPDTPWLWDREPRLGELLGAGTVFQYQYRAFADSAPWNVQGKVIRCLPDWDEEVPVCTVCEGIAPSEYLSGENGYQRYRTYLRRIESGQYVPGWVYGDSAEAITERLDTTVQWLLENVDT